MNGEVTDAALNWWASLRPVGYTMEDHLKNPTVNTTSYAEERLANAVAGYIEASIRFHEYMEHPTCTEKGKSLIRDAIRIARNGDTPQKEES
jgi:hypothetical protein